MPEIRPLKNGLSAEIVGIDLSRDLDETTIRWIENTLDEHPVLVFRDQKLGAPELAAFGKRLGQLRPHALLRYRHPEIPEISYVTNVDEAGKVDSFGVKRATAWHTDETYNAELPRATMLHAIEVPAAKGGTLFADMRAAYDALPEATKQLLAGLTGLHGYSTGPGGGAYEGQLTKAQEKDYPERRHPAVLIHPSSKRRILFVNPMHTHGFAGIERDEALHLIEELTNHAVEDRFTYYHEWRVGDLVMWDDQATMHRSAGDYAPGERRIFLRTIVHAA
jgi:taurine dioxygenase